MPRFFAGFIHNFVTEYNELANPFKLKLFAELNSMQSADGKVGASLLTYSYIYGTDSIEYGTGTVRFPSLFKADTNVQNWSSFNFKLGKVLYIENFNPLLPLPSHTLFENHIFFPLYWK